MANSDLTSQQIVQLFEAERRRMEQAMAISIGGGHGIGAMQQGAMQQAVYHPKKRFMEKLCARMDWDVLNVCERENIEVMWHGDTVFVFGITKDGKPYTLEGEAAMFPNDELITQLRMLKA